MLSRREALAALVVPALALRSAEPEVLRAAAFAAEVTPPIGHPCMGGGVAPATTIVDRLEALGFVLQGAGRPLVYVAVDWCEIRNDAYDRWRHVLATAAGTDPARVLVSSLHQHDAPIVDLTAQKLLTDHKALGAICDPEFHERAVQRVARAVRGAMEKVRPVTHIGTATAKVEQVASNRRYLDEMGQIRYDRGSATRDPKIRAADEGTIDPLMRLLTLDENDQPIVELFAYATHPMSYYGKGGVSADFVGLARRRAQASAEPGAVSIYLSGCSGNVTAGKYNDGAADNRPVLAERLFAAMKQARQARTRHRLESVEFRSVPLKLQARSSAGFSETDLMDRLQNDSRPFGQCLAALGLSWRRRVQAGQPIDLPTIDFGAAQLAVLPAEAYVEFQLLAQQVRPEVFTIVAGYGECGPGYIPIERSWTENDGNLNDWCWVSPGSEARMTEAIRRTLTR